MYNTKPCLEFGEVKYKKIVEIQGKKVKENRYLINNKGEVLSLTTGAHMSLELSCLGRPDPVTGKSDKRYYRVCIVMDDGSSKHFLVHRIVAEYFCFNDDPKHKTFVDHLDNNKLNNWDTNLEWVTPKENAIRSYDRGTSYTKGETHHFAVYSDEEVHQMCRLIEEGKSNKEIMQIMNLVDVTKFPHDHPARMRINSYLKALKTKSFRKDITSQYNLRGSTTIES